MFEFFKPKYDLREECIKDYGKDFGELYDILARGGAVGGFVYTIKILDKIEATRNRCNLEYSFTNRVRNFFGGNKDAS